MAQSVLALGLRLEAHQGIQEVGHAEACRAPGVQVPDEGFEVLGVVRELGRKGVDRLDDRFDQFGRAGVVGCLGHRSILDLEGLELGRG